MSDDIARTEPKPAAGSGPADPPRKPFFTLRVADVQTYRVCDDLSGILIFPMLVFGPWAFGTTQPWSIWTMNLGGFALGLLFLVKLFIREAKGYPAARWETFSARAGSHAGRRHPQVRFLTRALAGLTLAVLAFCLISAVNESATYDTEARSFDYSTRFIRWLPHSFDAHRSWFYFWMYLGLAGSFWAIWDWLQGMTLTEERDTRADLENEHGYSQPNLGVRLRWMLWLICLNGALLGIEAIVQRASGSNKLLFLVQPTVHTGGIGQFGPYAYRSNAAQYFNLIWPVCLGFWWSLHRARGYRAGFHHILLVCAAVMAACPVVSTSRGGALVAAAILVPAIFILAAAHFFSRQSRAGTVVLLVVFVALAASLGWYFGWKALAPRMEEVNEGYVERKQMYEAAWPMVSDYPVFGMGPGTFATVFQLYMVSSSTYWPEQLHNDWLETLITFGWTGLLLLLAALACVVFRWFGSGGIRGNKWFMLLAWLGPIGCLAHAVFDLPLQIHSILFLFLAICAVLFGMTRKLRGVRR